LGIGVIEIVASLTSNEIRNRKVRFESDRRVRSIHTRAVSGIVTLRYIDRKIAPHSMRRFARLTTRERDNQHRGPERVGFGKAGAPQKRVSAMIG
jgi:hypothetical protein